LLETAGFHYVAGLGVSTIVAALLILWRWRPDFPPTLACGGIFVVLIQWGFVALSEKCRRYMFGHLLEERSPRITFTCGVLGGVMVFGVPLLIAKVTSDQIASVCATLVPLCVYPIVVSFVVLRKVRGTTPPLN
jgi:hypothetical protein